MKKYRWATLSLFLNAAGFVLLFVAFQASSSKMAIYSSDQTIALCYGEHVLVWGDYHGSIAYGVAQPYDICKTGKPTAIVNSDSPLLARLGILCIFASFVAQYKGIDRSEGKLTKSQIRMLKNMGLLSD